MKHLRIVREDRRGVELPLWRAFRAWFVLFGRRWKLEYTTLSHFIDLRFEVDPSDRELQVCVGLYFFTFWLSLDCRHERFWRRWHAKYRYEGMETGVNYNLATGFSGSFLHWKFWAPKDSWDSTTPKWRDGTFNPGDFFFGSSRHSSRVLEEHDVEIPMPEGVYGAHVKLTEATWTWPRWPWAHRVLRAEIEIPGGVPHPGKGENSWDCGEDATYSMTCTARNRWEAIAAVVESSMRSRLLYGGKNWRPERKQPAIQ